MFCPQGQPVSLDHCLQHFISSETIKEVECENCTKVSAYIVKAIIFELHKNITLTFVERIQLKQGTIFNREASESQRTTFVKQLKLGKVSDLYITVLEILDFTCVYIYQ